MLRALSLNWMFIKNLQHICTLEKRAALAFYSCPMNQLSVSFTNKLLCLKAPVLQASCHVITVAVTLRDRAATLQMTVVTARMRRTVGLPVPLRMVTVDGRAPKLIIIIGSEVLDLLKAHGRHMTTHWWMEPVCDKVFACFLGITCSLNC